MVFNRKSRAKKQWEKQVVQARKQTRGRLDHMAQNRQTGGFPKYSPQHQNPDVGIHNDPDYDQSYGDPYHDYEDNSFNGAGNKGNDYRDDGTNTYDKSFVSENRDDNWNNPNESFTQATYDDNTYGNTNEGDHSLMSGNQQSQRSRGMESYGNGTYDGMNSAYDSYGQNPMGDNNTYDSYGQNVMQGNISPSRDTYEDRETNTYGTYDGDNSFVGKGMKSFEGGMGNDDMDSTINTFGQHSARGDPNAAWGSNPDKPVSKRANSKKRNGRKPVQRPSDNRNREDDDKSFLTLPTVQGSYLHPNRVNEAQPKRRSNPNLILDDGETVNRMRMMNIQKEEAAAANNVAANLISSNPLLACAAAPIIPCLIFYNKFATEAAAQQAAAKAAAAKKAANQTVAQDTNQTITQTKRNVRPENAKKSRSRPPIVNNDSQFTDVNDVSGTFDGTYNANDVSGTFDGTYNAHDVSGTFDGTYNPNDVSGTFDGTYNASGTFDNNMNPSKIARSASLNSRREIDSRASEFSRILSIHGDKSSGGNTKGTEFSNIVSVAPHPKQRNLPNLMTNPTEEFSQIQSVYGKKGPGSGRSGRSGAQSRATEFSAIESQHVGQGQRSRAGSRVSEFSKIESSPDEWGGTFDNTYNTQNDDDDDNVSRVGNLWGVVNESMSRASGMNNTYDQTQDDDDDNVSRVGNLWDVVNDSMSRATGKISRLTENFGGSQAGGSSVGKWGNSIADTFSRAGDTFPSGAESGKWDADNETYTQGSYGDDPAQDYDEWTNDAGAYSQDEETEYTQGTPMPQQRRKGLFKKVFKGKK